MDRDDQNMVSDLVGEGRRWKSASSEMLRWPASLFESSFGYETKISGTYYCKQQH